MVGTYFKYLQNKVTAARNDSQLFLAIVNTPFDNKVDATLIDLGIIVFLLVNKEQGTIDRIALSDTEQAAGAVKMSEKPFSDIKIPLDHDRNLIARAIQTGKPQRVADWKYLFIPAMSPRAARFNQAGAGIEFSYVYPLKARDGGALIFSFYQIAANIGPEHEAFINYYGNLADDALSQH